MRKFALLLDILNIDDEPLFLQWTDRLYIARNGKIVPVGLKDKILSKPHRIQEYQNEYSRNRDKPHHYCAKTVAFNLGVLEV